MCLSIYMSDQDPVEDSDTQRSLPSFTGAGVFITLVTNLLGGVLHSLFVGVFVCLSIYMSVSLSVSVFLFLLSPFRGKRDIKFST